MVAGPLLDGDLVVVTIPSSMEPLLYPLADGFSQRTKIFNLTESKPSRKGSIDSISGILGEVARRPNFVRTTGFQEQCLIAIGDALCINLWLNVSVTC